MTRGDTPDGGPAFPDIVTDFDYHPESQKRYPNTYSHGGMTLRDYFASKALQGLCANSDINPELQIAQTAWKLADDMLKNR